MTTTVNEPPAPTRSLRRIALWGAPGSGKTTFLAALNVAVARTKRDLIIFGADDESTEFLAANTSMLTTRRQFPEASQVLQPLSWTMNMQTQVTEARRFRRPRVQMVPLQFNIDLLDAPGRHFASVPGEASGPQEVASARSERLFGAEEDEEDEAVAAVPEDELIEHLAGCDGIIFLFDPIREQTKGDAYEYFQGTLLRIAQRRFTQARSTVGRLSQYVAVCVTKFDDPEIYRRARLSGFRTFAEDDPYMFPRVDDDKASAFFADLCLQSDLGNADLVHSAIDHNFMADRVRYFITSAIGFYLSPGARRFREQDFQNVAPDGRIRGAIHPINVVEPLLWLGQCVASAQQ